MAPVTSKTLPGPARITVERKDEEFSKIGMKQYQEKVYYKLYQSPPPVKRVARDAGYKPALLGRASRRWLSLYAMGILLRSLPIAPFKPHCC